MTSPASKPGLSADILPVLAAFCGFSIWTFGDAIIRYMNNYPTVLVAWLGSATALLMLVICSPFIGGFRKTFTDKKLGLRIVRGFCLAASGFLSYVAFANLDLPTAYAIIFAAPFVAKISSILLTRENIRPRSWAITALGFAGVLIVLRPGLVPVSIGSMAALGLAFFFGFGYVLTRFIGAPNQTFLSMGLFQYVIITVGLAYPAFSAYQTLPESIALGLSQLAMISAIGITGFIGSLLVAYAFTHGASAHIAPVHYIQILWGVFWGALLFHEYPDIWTLAGGAVIILAGILLVRFTRPIRPPAP